MNLSNNTSSNSYGNVQGNPEEIINKQKLDIKKLAQMIKDLQIKSGNEIKSLKEENNNLKEELKNTEKSTNDIMKHMAKGNLSEFTDVQKQYENEICANKEIIKNLSETIK